MISLKFKKVKCPVCDSKKFKKFNQKTRVSNFPTKIGLFNLKCFDVICDECSLVYSNPEPTAKSLKEYYSNKFLNKSLYPDYDVKKQVNFFKKIARKNDKILEIGSSNNYLINLLKKNGYKAYGSDFLTKTAIKNKKYNFILLNHTLEHIPRPKKYLRSLRKKLDNNGTLIIEVPDLNQYQKDNTILVAEHITHFTDTTLKKLLFLSGFIFVNKEKENNSRKYSIRMTFKKGISNKENINFNQKKYKKTKKIFSKALSLNQKRLDNFKNLSKKINLNVNNEIYFWGCNSIFVNIYFYLNKAMKNKLNLVDENYKKIKYLTIDHKNKIFLKNPNKIKFLNAKDVKFVVCAISWKNTISKKILSNGVLKKNIIIPKI